MRKRGIVGDLLEGYPAYGAMVSQLSKTLASANKYLMNELSSKGLKDIVPSHGDILVKLFADGSTSMASLAEAIGKDPSTVTALVKKLKDAGYVKARKNPCDKRIVDVGLTEQGQELGSSIAKISHDLIGIMEANITRDDLELTYNTLKKMKTAFDEENMNGSQSKENGE